ncbi:MAG TPA: hypothetical protein VE860_14310 [Chthoniobacterales bacterium]|jgi:hypothetical protein|nr:hypothetical protein [Chthoniobacterales bacterium]
MLTAVCLRALGLATVTAAAATASADICDDYSREIDAHIAMLRTIEKRAAVVSNSEQAVEVINLYVDEMINWRRQMAPLDRAVYEMDQGNVENAPPLCQKAIERFNFFAKEDMDLAERLGDLLVKYISDPAVVSAWRRMQDLPKH